MRQDALSLEEAQIRLLALAAPLEIERRDIAAALGCYLAEDLVAARTQPAADMSAMDGYAVRAQDITGPWRLVGESAAGHPFTGSVHAGEAVRVSTGALMPSDAGVVILQEDVARVGIDHDVTVRLTGTAPAPPERHIRVRGLDFNQGATLLPAGTRLGAVQSALAIAAGHADVAIHREPRVVVIDTGDELRPGGEPCALHQIPASNGPMLCALIAGLPTKTRRIGPVPDDLDALTAAFAAASEADLIVTTGGASVGDHDLILPALEAWGAKLEFWRIAIKPGKPLLVATREAAGRSQIVLGLPGNPASAYVTGFLFMLPVLRRLLGATAVRPTLARMQLAEPLRQGGSRREFLRARWDGRMVLPQVLQDSGVLGALAASNALIDRPAGSAASARGEWIDGYLLENGGIA